MNCPSAIFKPKETANHSSLKPEFVLPSSALIFLFFLKRANLRAHGHVGYVVEFQYLSQALMPIDVSGKGAAKSATSGVSHYN